LTTRVSGVRRAWLVVPAASLARVDRARSLGADVIVVDLAYFPGGGARADTAAAAEAIARLRGASAEVFLQVRAESVGAQLPACVQPGLTGIVVTGLESAEPLQQADDLLSGLERQQSRALGEVELIASIETARGNQAAEAIAAATPRTTGLTLGRADLVMDLRPEPSGEIHLLPYLAQRLVLLAAGYGQVPIGAWWSGPDRGLSAPPPRTLAAARRGWAMGFKGALGVHEDQVTPLRQGFTPSAADQQWALDVLARAEGGDSRYGDPGAVAQARGLLGYAAACAARDAEHELGREGSGD
jgi:citrate lyase subunit beta/citryl-CoA lyase